MEIPFGVNLFILVRASNAGADKSRRDNRAQVH
jgi:hypothetical protein